MREHDQIVAETGRGRDEDAFSAEFAGRGGEGLTSGVIPRTEQEFRSQTKRFRTAAVDDPFKLCPDFRESVVPELVRTDVTLEFTQGDRQIKPGVEGRPGFCCWVLSLRAMKATGNS